MLKLIGRVFLVVLLASASVMIAPVVAAQTPPPTVETPLIIEPERIEGLEQAISRDYRWMTGNGTPEALAGPTPGASPMPRTDGTFVNFWVGDFDSPEHAEQFADITNVYEFAAFVFADFRGSGIFNAVDIAESDQVVAAIAGTIEPKPMENDIFEAGTAYVMLQDDDRVVFLWLTDFDEGAPAEAVNAVLPIATTILTSPVGEGDPVFDEEGMSRGGLWEVLPAAGDMPGLEPLEDFQLWPLSEG